MPSALLRLTIASLLGACCTLVVPASPRLHAQASGFAVVLVTLDGARTEEIFGGLDADVFTSTLRENQRLEDQPAYKRFWAGSPDARREKLMPFFWGTLMRQHGGIAGNRSLGSRATLTNTHRVSYPGYAEILLGEAHDDTIKSNDAIRNPYPTVLEELQARLELTKAQVAVFTSWNVFDAIVESREGALTVNAGFERFESPDPSTALLSRLQFETPTPWDSVRHDIYTFRFAMDHLQRERPRVLYLALGETDDWAHAGRYDRVLETYARSDEYLRELWTWLQSDAEYRGRTLLVVTTDHGRGHTPTNWRDHGAKVDGAQDVWIALASPAQTMHGEWREQPDVHTNQIAATLAGWMGVDWRALRPAAGPPIRAH
jgi:Type I phosphodiesterase / nucleotide pyrophosphatase